MKSTYTGPATIFRHDKGGHTFYSVAVSRRNSQNETEFAYKLVQFKRGVDLADRSKIDIQNAWETFYLNNNGEAVFYVFISDFVLQQGSAAGYTQRQQYGQQTGYTRQQMAVGPGGYRERYGQPVQNQPIQTQQPQAAQSVQPQPPAQESPQIVDAFEQINEEVPF